MAAVVRRVDLDPERFQAVAELLVEFPGLTAEQLRSLVESSTSRRRRPEPVRPRSYAEVTAAVESGWLTKNEARKLAGLSVRRGPARKSKEEGS
ncbi:MAG: hypothetical protein J2P57_14395 [Acidimicrobiaceae bacterium]|nr:hypothetical protein [Acidimicrobiaceae bacterium]